MRVIICEFYFIPGDEFKRRLLLRQISKKENEIVEHVNNHKLRHLLPEWFLEKVKGRIQPETTGNVEELEPDLKQCQDAAAVTEQKKAKKKRKRKKNNKKGQNAENEVEKEKLVGSVGVAIGDTEGEGETEGGKVKRSEEKQENIHCLDQLQAEKIQRETQRKQEENEKLLKQDKEKKEREMGNTIEKFVGSIGVAIGDTQGGEVVITKLDIEHCEHCELERRFDNLMGEEGSRRTAGVLEMNSGISAEWPEIPKNENVLNIRTIDNVEEITVSEVKKENNWTVVQKSRFSGRKQWEENRKREEKVREAREKKERKDFLADLKIKKIRRENQRKQEEKEKIIKQAILDKEKKEREAEKQAKKNFIAREMKLRNCYIPDMVDYTSENYIEDVRRFKLMSYPNEPGEHRRWTDEQWKDWKLVEKSKMAAEPLSIEEEAEMYKLQWLINDRALRRHDAQEAKRCEKIFDDKKWEAELLRRMTIRKGEEDEQNDSGGDSEAVGGCGQNYESGGEENEMQQDEEYYGAGEEKEQEDVQEDCCTDEDEEYGDEDSLADRDEEEEDEDSGESAKETKKKKKKKLSFGIRYPSILRNMFNVKYHKLRAAGAKYIKKSEKENAGLKRTIEKQKKESELLKMKLESVRTNYIPIPSEVHEVLESEEELQMDLPKENKGNESKSFEKVMCEILAGHATECEKDSQNERQEKSEMEHSRRDSESRVKTQYEGPGLYFEAKNQKEVKEEKEEVRIGSMPDINMPYGLVTSSDKDYEHFTENL